MKSEQAWWPFNLYHTGQLRCSYGHNIIRQMYLCCKNMDCFADVQTRCVNQSEQRQRLTSIVEARQL